MEVFMLPETFKWTILNDVESTYCVYLFSNCTVQIQVANCKDPI